MTPEFWAEAEALFTKLSELPSYLRVEALDSEPASAELKAEVLSLLKVCREDTDPDIEGVVSDVARLVSERQTEPDVWCGRQLDKYRLVRQLGRGGMGAVYEAERVDEFEMRTAIKIIRPGYDSGDLIRRFRLERQILAKLEHPYIARLVDGGSVEGVPYLVMEYVDGRNITDYCREWLPSLRDRLLLFEKVCRGVQYAHEHGIIHRDLKPNNILVMPDGEPKLLDFGIAKMLTGMSSEGEEPLTATGCLVMTPEYASPEQIRHEAVTAATDVYALGALLFELVTGRRAQKLHTKSPAEIVRVVCETDTPLPSAVASVPLDRSKSDANLRGLDLIVGKAMQKAASARYENAGALGADVRRYLEGEPIAGVSAKWPRAVASWLNKRRHGLLMAALLVALASMFWLAKRKPDFWENAKVNLDTEEVLFPSISPDGERLVYCSRERGRWTLFLKHLHLDLAAENLTPAVDGDVEECAWSPDGKRIAFHVGGSNNAILVIDVDTRQVREVARELHNPSWSPDGKQLVAATEAIAFPENRLKMVSTLHIVDVASGQAQPLSTQDGVQPSWSPHGWRIAFWHTEAGGRNISTMKRDGTDIRAVTDDKQMNWNPVWSGDGSNLYFASDRGGSMGLWRIAMEEKTGALKGKPEKIPASSSYVGQVSAARSSDKIAYLQTDQRSNLQIVPLTRQLAIAGAPAFATKGTHHIMDPDWSPTGDELAFHDVASNSEDLYVMNPDRGGREWLTQDAARDREPRWSPDGESILFFSNRSGHYELWRLARANKRLTPLTRTDGPSVLYGVWSPDADQIAYNVLGRNPYIVKVSALGGGRSGYVGTQLPNLGSLTTAASDWSPDGKMLAGFVGTQGVITYNLAAKSYRQWTSIGRDPVWLADSKRLLYRDSSAIYALDTRDGRSWKVLSVAPEKISGRFSISRDGARLVYSLTSSISDVWTAQLSKQ